MKAYKLFKPDMTTYRGYQWELGRKEVITRAGRRMCSPQVFHAYSSDLLAALMNPIHAAYDPAILCECEVSTPVADDGTKIGVKECTPLREIDLPRPSTHQRVRFGILAALAVNEDPGFRAWVEGWLSGKDRSGAAARAAAYAAYAAWAAVDAAADAADAARAADAAWAAAWAARAAAQIDLADVARKAFGEG